MYLKKGNHDKAIAQYKSLLAQNPEQVEPNMIIGALYDAQKKGDLARQHYEEALRVNPEFAPAANNLAYILAENDKDLNRALELAKLAKEKLPNDPGVMDTVGWVYYKKGLYDSAIVELADSLEKIPENPMVHYHLGMAYIKKSEPDKARRELEKALELDAKFEKAGEVRKVLGEI
jgi:tetratricopeptide (TPR) repeat protein